ncbi:type VI secretion system tip protein TssI/VgrG [Pseudomonas aeruginosa]|nr:type VI secretion system tip protein TssI/VgrG [Pseudomonas aeruginosa]
MFRTSRCRRSSPWSSRSTASSPTPTRSSSAPGYPERQYRVQYDESDLHFVQRLCAEGASISISSTAPRRTCWCSATPDGVPRLGRPTAYVHDSGLVADEPVIKRQPARPAAPRHHPPRLRLREAAAAAGSRQPPRCRRARPSGPGGLRLPGHFVDRQRGKLLSQRGPGAPPPTSAWAKGSATSPLLVSGHFLEIAEHPRAEWNDLWLLSEVFHEGKQPQVLEENVTSDVGQHGRLPAGLPQPLPRDALGGVLPPAAGAPKPRVLGSQTAVVTGPPGEEIHCDRYGRVGCSSWDREGQGDDKSSCWLRVASGWAGNGYGGIVIPRVGMEVLVDFLEGDPDQPLVSGCVLRHPPIALRVAGEPDPQRLREPQQPWRRWRQRAAHRGSQGQEQIFVHAQRDWDENIEHDQKIRVGHERHDTVEANSYSEFKAEGITVPESARSS